MGDPVIHCPAPLAHAPLDPEATADQLAHAIADALAEENITRLTEVGGGMSDPKVSCTNFSGYLREAMKGRGFNETSSNEISKDFEFTTKHFPDRSFSTINMRTEQFDMTHEFSVYADGNNNVHVIQHFTQQEVPIVRSFGKEEFVNTMNGLKADPPTSNESYRNLIGKDPDTVMKDAAQARLDEGLERNEKIKEALQEARAAKAALAEAQEPDTAIKQAAFNEAKKRYEDVKDTKWDEDDVADAEDAVDNAKGPEGKWLHGFRVVQHERR